MKTITTYWLMVPKSDAERIYDPMDIEQGYEKEGWVGVVSANSVDTIESIARMNGAIKSYRVEAR